MLNNYVEQTTLYFEKRTTQPLTTSQHKEPTNERNHPEKNYPPPQQSLPNRYSLTYLCAAFCAVLFLAAAPVQADTSLSWYGFERSIKAAHQPSGLSSSYGGYFDVITDFWQLPFNEGVYRPSQNDVTYTSYGMRIDISNYAGMFTVANNKSYPLTLGNVKGDFSWTITLKLNDQIVYNKVVTNNGVSMDVNGKVIAAYPSTQYNENNTPRFEKAIAGSDSAYIDLMDYIIDVDDYYPDAQPSLWLGVSDVTARLYDGDTGEPLADSLGIWDAFVKGYALFDTVLAYEATYTTGNGSNTTPEPATLLVFGTGLAGLALARRRRK